MRDGVKVAACSGIISVLALAGVQHAFSFLIDDDGVSNPITTGYVDVSGVDFGDEHGLIEGEGSGVWNPTVRNTGPVSAYVRAWIVFDGDTGSMPEASMINLDCWSAPDGDGYLYCFAPIEPNQSSPLVFTQEVGGETLGSFIVKFEAAAAVDPATGALFPTPQAAFEAVC